MRLIQIAALAALASAAVASASPLKDALDVPRVDEVTVHSAAVDSVLNVKDKADGKAKEHLARAEDAGHDAAKSAKKAADKTTKAARQSGKKAKDAASDVADTVKSGADRTAKKALRTASEVAPKTTKAGKRAADKTKAAAADAADAVEEHAEEAKDAVHGAVGKATRGRGLLESLGNLDLLSGLNVGSLLSGLRANRDADGDSSESGGSSLLQGLLQRDTETAVTQQPASRDSWRDADRQTVEESERESDRSGRQDRSDRQRRDGSEAREEEEEEEEGERDGDEERRDRGSEKKDRKRDERGRKLKGSCGRGAGHAVKNTQSTVHKATNKAVDKMHHMTTKTLKKKGLRHH